MISIAIDWGSSSFRAYRFDRDGSHIDTRSSERGIKFVADGRFEQCLREEVGDWIEPGDRLLLSGMIGSRNGWLETDYLPCPANLGKIFSHSRTLDLPDMRLYFLPGVSQADPADVMRGEELQLLGASRDKPSGLFVIPGTHCKWASIQDTRIDGFRSMPTGELFGLLCNHSLIGALMQADGWDAAAFADGVDRGYRQTQTLGDLFSARSRVLLGQLTGNAARAWLSGLLIGSEIREGMQTLAAEPGELTLIGSQALCQKYSAAFEQLQIATTLASGDVTLEAYRQIIGTLPEKQ